MVWWWHCAFAQLRNLGENTAPESSGDNLFQRSCNDNWVGSLKNKLDIFLGIDGSDESQIEGNSLSTAQLAVISHVKI